MADVSYIVCGSEEELAKAFASVVRRRYHDFLSFWASTLQDDVETKSLYFSKMQSEPPIVEENAYFKIIDIIQNREKNISYYKKYLWWRSKKWIVISEQSDFYSDLLDGESISHAFMFELPYIINRKGCTIEKMEEKKD